MANPQAKRMTARMIQTAVYIAGIARMNTVHTNTAHLNRGEGVDREIIFIIAIHPPPPEKLCQRAVVPEW
jgi:hypothetical protein